MPMKLEESEFDTVDKIRANKDFQPVMDKFINYWALNGREYKRCND